MSGGSWLGVAYLASAAVALASAMVLLRRRKDVVGATEFATTLVLEAIWAAGGAMELASTSLSAKRFWDDVQLPASLLVPTEIFLFALAYTGRTPTKPGRLRAGLALLPAACIAFVFSDGIHGLARADARLIPAEPVDLLFYTFSPIEKLTFLQMYLCLGTAIVLLATRLAREHAVFRNQTAVALFATALPASMGLFALTDVRIFGQRDVSPLMFGVSGLFIVVALGRIRFLELVPIARDAVLESIGDPVFLLDARHRVVDANPAACSTSGRSLVAMIGRPLREIVPELEVALGAPERDESARGVEVEVGTAQGPRAFEMAVADVRDAPGSHLGTAVMLRDVTERREAIALQQRVNAELEARVDERTRQLRDANDALTAEMSERLRSARERSELALQLQAAQKMEAIGRLAGGVAHDFNNLLTAILCNVELLDRRLPADSNLRQLVAPVRKAGESAAGLTRQLLSFSRHHIVEPQAIDADASLGDVERLLERIVGEDVSLEFAGKAGGAHLRCDPGQLEQVIVNLAVNARDALESGGRIRVATRCVHLDDERLCADGTRLPAGDYVDVSVTDDGSGIPAEVRGRIFEPFFTTKEIGKGTGLGLSVVVEVARQHGAAVDLETAVGVGTTFHVLFPRIEATALDRRPAPAQSESPRGTERVLVVEDQELVRDTIRRALELLGYRVTACESTTCALESVERAEPFDILVTDVVLADGSGRRLAERVRERWPELAVLFISGYTDDVVLRHGVERGELEFLAKPFTEAQLAIAVRRALTARGAA